jgi:hypothetical protein
MKIKSTTEDVASLSINNVVFGHFFISRGGGLYTVLLSERVFSIKNKLYKCIYIGMYVKRFYFYVKIN